MTGRLNNSRFWCYAKVLVIPLLLLYIEYRIDEVRQYFHKQVTSGKTENEPILSYKTPSITDSEDFYIIYNRVPKTGSTSFVNIAYDLCKRNHFKVLHVNVTSNMHFLTLQNQMRFAQNASQWDEMKPALYHGHMAYIDFNKFGVKKFPLYINIIRQPLERLVSYYYFLRYGDTYRPHLIRKKHGDNVTFDECVANNLAGCSPDNLWLQIPFFCGHSAECWQTGSTWALEQAKRNLVENYLLVGVTEEMEDFVRLLEIVLPRIFKGATDYYLNSKKSHLRTTTHKGSISKETRLKFERSIEWKLENEFYEFALEQFRRLLKNSPISDKFQTFYYEKIRPK